MPSAMAKLRVRMWSAMTRKAISRAIWSWAFSGAPDWAGMAPIFPGVFPIFSGVLPIFRGIFPAFSGISPTFPGVLPIFLGETSAFLGEIGSFWPLSGAGGRVERYFLPLRWEEGRVGKGGKFGGSPYH